MGCISLIFRFIRHCPCSKKGRKKVQRRMKGLKELEGTKGAEENVGPEGAGEAEGNQGAERARRG